MIVTIPKIVEHAGHDCNLMTIEISDYCPVCGGKRGEPFQTRSYDGSRIVIVSGWTNPCGHVDKYSAVRDEFYARNYHRTIDTNPDPFVFTIYHSDLGWYQLSGFKIYWNGLRISNARLISVPKKSYKALVRPRRLNILHLTDPNKRKLHLAQAKVN